MRVISKNEQAIKNKLEAIGSRQTATWLMNHFITKYTVTMHDDLVHTAAIVDRLNSIEECFDNQDFSGAIAIAEKEAQQVNCRTGTHHT